MPMEKKPFLSAKGLLLCALLLLTAGIAYAALSLSPRGTLALVEVDGQVVLDEQGEKKLLGAKAYPRGLRVDDLHMEYDETTQIFTISFLVTDRKGRVLAGTDFDVQRINNKTGS